MNILKGDKTAIGQTFTVTVDRPIGEEHPKHKGLLYPVNYGYVEGLTAGDGEEQDVYILGIDRKMEMGETISLVIVAIIFRENDNEDKWVGVPKEMLGDEICCECNIVHKTYFQEQYYKSQVFCLYEKTCGAVIYTGEGNDRRYFLIKNKSGHIGFPKGHIEYNETEKETALREVYEECGLNIILSDNFRAEYTFRTLENTEKTSVFFAGSFDKQAAVKIQQEEVIGDWLLSYGQAMEKLNWEQDKEILRKAEEFLNAQ